MNPKLGSQTLISPIGKKDNMKQHNDLLVTAGN